MFQWLKQSNGTVHPAVKVAGAGVATSAAAAIAIAVTVIGPLEGYAPKPYVDRIGTGHPITWCFGETKADGPVPPMNKTFTKAECEVLLERSLTNKYDPEVRKCVHVPMPPHREAAILSFTFNLGAGPICNGPVGRYLNAGNVAAACHAMLAYNHSDGVTRDGLIRRRKLEQGLCLRND